MIHTEKPLKCRDCGHPAPRTESGVDATSHAEDCAGVARRILTLDHA